MISSFLWILLACILYGALHTLLAGHSAKEFARRRLGLPGARYYRLFFNIQAGVTLLPVFILAWRLPDAEIYRIPAPWSLLALLIQILALVGLWLGVRQTGAAQFLGLAPGVPTGADALISPNEHRAPVGETALRATFGEEGKQLFVGFDPLAGQNQHKKNAPALEGGGWGVVENQLPDLKEKAEAEPMRLVTGGLYRWVRHPLYTCGLLLLWLIPTMTWNLLALAIGLTVYILVGIVFEERKLLREFGPAYAEYRRRTPGLIPFLKI